MKKLRPEKGTDLAGDLQAELGFEPYRRLPDQGSPGTFPLPGSLLGSMLPIWDWPYYLDSENMGECDGREAGE